MQHKKTAHFRAFIILYYVSVSLGTDEKKFKKLVFQKASRNDVLE